MGLKIIVFLFLTVSAYAEPLPQHEGLYPLSEQVSIEMSQENRIKREDAQQTTHLISLNKHYVNEHSFPWSALFSAFFLLFLLPVALKLISKNASFNKTDILHDFSSLSKK